ncbi:MAG: spondin domain-containing protein [Phormidesmis sp.]
MKNALLRSAFTAAAIATAAILSDGIATQASPTQTSELNTAQSTETDTSETVEVVVTIDNLAPDQGLILTPLWAGFHDGSYDIYEPGLAASAGLEQIAEDGSPMALSAAFMSSDEDWVDGVLTGDGISPDSPPLIGPGSSATLTFEVDPANSYFSYASMILPSNDGFIANESGTAHRVFDANGEFVATDFVVIGGQIQDAGTEVNDEVAENVPVLGQMAPNTGTDEDGVVTNHAGFAADGNVLTAFPAADFEQSLYPVARIRVELAE